jgi:hypothetical protein
MANIEALSANNITTVGVIVIVVLVVVGFLLSLLISAVIARLLIAVVVVVLAIVVWQQRGHVQDRVNDHVCDTHATFFGIHVDTPSSVKKACSSKG